MPSLLAIYLLTVVLLGAYFSLPARAAPFQGSYTGSQSCRPCHEKFYTLWEPSHHGKAMQPYSDAFASAELTPQAKAINIGDATFLAVAGKGQGFILEKRPDGEEKYPIQHVMGGKNVYYFLTPLERGRLQVLPLAYDVNDKHWIDMAKSGVRHGSDQQVDWRDTSFTFNTACQGCHVSQFALNYDEKTDSYATTWAEPGINCESCHGPAEEHIRVCEEAKKGTVPADLKITTVSQRRGFKPEMVDATCSGCHAKAIPLAQQFVPGESFWDHYDIALLEHPDYYPDGRDLGENYTYTSWLMSPCLKGGNLDCLHCHTSSGRFRQKKSPNQACLPCHGKKVNAPKKHTMHKPGDKSPTCVSCHMPMTTFAKMNRSDHSMRPPVPAATIRFGSPNACNECHTDKTPQWADKSVRKWRKRDYQAATVSQADLIQAARDRDWSKLPAMIKALEDPKHDVVFTTSLLRLLRHCPKPERMEAYQIGMQSQFPLVRAAGAVGMGDLLSNKPNTRLVKLLDDPYKLVRIRAARALAPYSAEAFNVQENSRLSHVTEEMLEALVARPDIWSAHFNVGNFYQSKNQLSQALSAYETALRLEPKAPILLVNSAMVSARVGKFADAEKLLERAVKNDPQNPIALFNLGLLKVENGQSQKAEDLLKDAFAADPTMDRAAANLAALIYKKDIQGAVSFAKKAYKINPSRKNALNLAFYLKASGDEKGAQAISGKALQIKGFE